MTERIGFHEYLIELAQAASRRATCPKRSVGAVLTDSRNVVVSTGYNGVPRGFPHCSKNNDCGGIKFKAPESHGKCVAVHAEANAIIAAGPRAVGGTLACTLSPCRECCKLIVNAGIKKVVYQEKWKHYEDAQGTKYSPGNLLYKAGIEVRWLPDVV